MNSPATRQSAPFLQVSGLTITGSAGPIVSSVDLSIDPGETLGIVGESGSGKSMTVRGLMGILPDGVHASGSVKYQGQELMDTPSGHRRHADFAMMFQDPFTMLNPLMRAGRHISETLTDDHGHRLRGKAARAEEVRRLAEVAISDPGVADRLPYELSGGMRQRVGIAATLSSDPALLIADEATTALDVTTQASILKLLKNLQAERNMALMLITHDLSVASLMCDRILVMYAGRLIEQGPTADVIERPLHPYTRGLIDSNPPADRRLANLPSMPGSVPRAYEVLQVCPFLERCGFATQGCRHPVTLSAHGPGRSTACTRINQLEDRLAVSADVPARTAASSPEGREPEPLINITGLQKMFGSKAALEGVSLQVRAGECVGIVGESGSGKTTIGRCIVGLEQPTSGSITVDGIDASNYATLGKTQLNTLRSGVQMAFQDPYSTLSPARSIGAVLAEAVRLDHRDRAATRGRVTELLGLVGLPASYARRKPKSLSGGERQRVALARALARRPKAIVCDEIVSALDVSVQAQILNLLNALRTTLGVALLFITHDLAVVRQVTSRVYVLRGGHVIESGRTGELLDHPQQAYTQELLASIPEIRPHS